MRGKVISAARFGWTFVLATGAVVVLAWYVWAPAQDRNPDFKPMRVVPPFAPLTQFPIKPVRDAANVLNPSELVLGVTVGKEALAYPINMLTGPEREILNDTLGGKAIAATW